MTDHTQSVSTKVEFIERHQPAFESGDYTITVEQHILIQDRSVDESFKLKQQEQKFSILGPRFSLDPQIVRAVFPPSGNLGENSNVLPHIILDRSTLPWERLAIPLSPDELNALARDDSQRTDTEKELANRGMEKKKIPWLALLLFDIEDVTDQNVL